MVDATRAGGGQAGEIWHTAVVSEAVPSYAPGEENLSRVKRLLGRPVGLASTQTPCGTPSAANPATPRLKAGIPSGQAPGL